MLSNTLNTNEIKGASGIGQTFSRLSTNERSTEFGIVPESPNLPGRLKISHQETGVGFSRRRRSVVRFDLTVASTVDATKTCQISAYTVLDAPVGALTASTEFGRALAYLMSFLASTGADNVIKYDSTGNGAATLISGGL